MVHFRGFLTPGEKIGSVTGSIDIIIVYEGSWHLLTRNEDQATTCIILSKKLKLRRSTIFSAALPATVLDLS